MGVRAGEAAARSPVYPTVPTHSTKRTALPRHVLTVMLRPVFQLTGRNRRRWPTQSQRSHGAEREKTGSTPVSCEIDYSITSTRA